MVLEAGRSGQHFHYPTGVEDAYATGGCRVVVAYSHMPLTKHTVGGRGSRDGGIKVAVVDLKP